MASETPKETEARLLLEEQCAELAAAIGHGLSTQVGFALFLFDFGDGGNMAYMSSAQREDMNTMLREFLAREGVQ